jgi:simple sugar transport system permease protein
VSWTLRRHHVEAAVMTTAALVLAALAFGVFVALNGLNPLEVYAVLYLGAFGTGLSIEATLTQAAPLMLTALCTAIPARAGLLVIGGEGALVVGGVVAVLAGVALAHVPAWVATAGVLLAGALGGAAWVSFPGALKHWRGVNETIATLLLNYIAIAILNHLVSGPIRDFAVSLKPTSWSIPAAFMIGTIPGLRLHWGVVFGVVACLVASVLLRRTTFGFSVAVLGGNLRAAQMVGLSTGWLTLAACALGGAAAGLAGAVEVAAVHGAASSSLVAGFGYAGILVAFLARHNPLAIIVCAVLVGGISASGGLLQRRFDMSDAATLVFQGMIFLSVLASHAFGGRRRTLRGGEGAA